MIIWLVLEQERNPRLQYTIDQLEALLSCVVKDPDEIRIDYSPDPGRGDIWIRRSQPGNWSDAGCETPSVDASNALGDGPAWVDGQYRIWLDIVETTFRWLTMVETELSRGGSNPEDPNGLTEPARSDCAGNGIPIVDACVGLLEKGIRASAYRRGLRVVEKNRWSGKECAVCLTHDVDAIRGKSALRYGYWLWGGLTGAIRGRFDDLKVSIERVGRWATLIDDPYWVFEDYAEHEERFGFMSTFFVLSLTLGIGLEGRRYSVWNSRLRKTLRRLNDRGWEVGLHASRRGLDNTRDLRREKSRLQDVCSRRLMGVRQHYLRFSGSDTWRAQALAGFEYDSSIGWSRSFGYRTGTCRPFRVYDVKRDSSLDLWELPLCIMDGAYDTENAGPPTVDQMMSVVQKQIQVARRCAGVTTILWHTNRFNNVDAAPYRDAYREILAYLANANVFVGSCEQVLGEWKRSEEEAKTESCN